MASRNKGFTLIELLAVIAILGILAGLIFTGAEKAIEKAKVSKTKVAIQSLSIALTNFERDMGSFSERIGSHQMASGVLNEKQRIELVEILSGKTLKREGGEYIFRPLNDIQKDPRWNGPYLDPKVSELEPEDESKYKIGQLVDAWRNPLIIHIKREGMDYDSKLKYRPYSFQIYSFGPNRENDVGRSRGKGLQGRLADDINNWD